MPKTKPPKGIGSEIVAFFASVKLALVLLITLAVISILGTILPQGESLAFYDQHYSPVSGKLIRFFQLQDMYHSWWFQWLLLLLTANLIVCSLKRFSSTWKVVTAPSRSVSNHLFETLYFHRKFTFRDRPQDPLAWVQSLLSRQFGKPVALPAPQGTAFFLEKGRFSRFGVYLVHLSILVIFVGAIIGSLFGFKGSLELMEGEEKDRIFIKGAHSLRELGFAVHLDRFTMTFYPDQMPKEYRSDLSIREKGREKERAEVRVNDPFTYKGITFYQSTWDQIPVSIELILKKGGQESNLEVRMEERIQVPGTSYALEAVRYANNLGNLGPALGVILFNNSDEVDKGWILARHPAFHGNRLGEFQLTIKEIKTRYVSGFQVNRDPGVWFIWIGASLMLLGFIITFYFSHQQVWVWIRENTGSKSGERIEILMGGTAHKNRRAFVLKMEQITEKVQGS
ncbi:MAG: cytochrome c biogenesis protein ResB [Deltaproteobacteria bacterium]|nr:cytochrome c biogenesis protein ResB [Deltaproteobacteria bacterium]